MIGSDAGRDGVLGEEGGPSVSLDTKKKDCQGSRARASMKEYSLSTL